MTLNATLKIILPLLLITASAKAQNISLDADSADVSLLLIQIQAQSALGLNISPDALAGAKKVTIHVKNKPLTYVLEEICKGQPFRFIPNSKSIVIVRKSSAEDQVKGKKLKFYWGQFTNNYGEGVGNINVYDWQHQLKATSDSHGKFPLKDVRPGDFFKFTSPDIDTGSFNLPTDKTFKIEVTFRDKTAYLPKVEVIQIGIHQMPKKRYTGSSASINADVLGQRTTPDLYGRIEGTIPGVLLSVNPIPNIYQPKYLSIGGRSTIYSAPDPLIVLNGFRFAGRLEDLNPDDIETITILREASATALWGALSGNAVMVVTTKTGKFNHPTRVSFNASVSYGNERDAFAPDMLPPSDRFFIDSFLARKGYFNPLIRSQAHPYVPELALRILNNRITDAELAYLKGLDIRNDLNKYFYRKFHQKHFSLQLTGGKTKHSYLFSLGLDHSLPELKLGNTKRLNLTLNYNLRPVEGLEVSTTAGLTWYKEHNVNGEPAIPVTYASLTNASGEPAAMSYKWNQFFIDTAGIDANGQRKLRDWSYRPLHEFRIRNENSIYIDRRINIGIKYNRFAFLNGLEAAVYGQYEITSAEQNTINDKDGFYANDLVNSFTQVNGVTVERPVPTGNILDHSFMRLNTLNLRAQLSYSGSLGRSTSFNILLGSDRTVTRGRYNVRKIYDYTPDKPEGQSGLNYQTLYPQYYFPASSKYIPQPSSSGKQTVTNNISYYSNVNIQVKGRYFASLSARTDRSNIFGSKTNNKLNPLGSLGVAWDISAEDFYRPRIFEFLKVRSSIGFNGNPPLGVSAIQTIRMLGKNENGDLFADINNPSLPGLKWETVMTYNFGLTFRLVEQVLEGTVDYYYKKSTDLIDYKSIDPTVGVPTIMGNVASMKSHNIDLFLTTRNLNRMLRWKTVFVFSYVKDYVTNTDTTLYPAWMYCDQYRFSVVRNRPLYGIYSFATSGLDQQGDPVGPDKNKDYQSMTLTPGPDALIFRGRSTPPIFGSITNDFNYKRLGLSVTLTYKFNYYYRKSSVNYTGLFDGSDRGSTDFSRRWQKPGDEAHTSVPGMTYPASNLRDYFYIYSDLLVKRADFIRLQNIHLSYDLEGEALRKLHLRTANFYINCSNAGIIWRATKSKLDHDRLQGFPNPTIFTFGFKGVLK